jgi:hypothetical protein
VDEIGKAEAKGFVERHHYSRSFPARRYSFGLFHGRTLVGVAVFSVPMSQAIIPKYCGTEPNAGVELGRFVLLDSVPANGETWFLSRAFKLLPDSILAVLSYSDPLPRKSLAGQLVKPGHVGTIYQAANAAYFGQNRPSTIYLADNGEIVSRRALSKLKNGERGRDHVREMLTDLVGPKLRGESDAGYVERIKHSLRAIRHPGNHTYAWALNKRIKITSKQTYPKAA